MRYSEDEMQAPVAVVSINPMSSRPLSIPASDPLVALTTENYTSALGGLP